MSNVMMRHGQCGANKYGVYAGRTDWDLTMAGKEEAIVAGQKLRERQMRFVRVVVSPLVRAQQTAQLVLPHIEVTDPKLVTEEELTEYDMGSFTGEAIDETQYPNFEIDPTAERIPDFVNRVGRAILRHVTDDGDTLFVVHTGVIQVTRAIEQGLNPHEAYNMPRPANGEFHDIDVAALRENFARAA